MSVMTAIDLFAGAGGFTSGALLAGVDVLWAANHWQQSVDVHRANHPDVEHACQDLQQYNWRRCPDHDLLLASPACQGHSEAGQPGRGRPGVEERQQLDRNTAWAVVACAETKRPRTILVENVRPFQRWALLPAWISALELLGYCVCQHLFDAADWGVPQNRVRVVISARLGEPLELVSPGLEHRGFGECIDWHAGEWKPLKSKSWGVQSRVKAGRARGLGTRFLTHYVTGHKGRALSRPIGCITTKDQWAVVKGGKIRMLSLTEARRAQDFEDDYHLPDTRNVCIRMLGNAIPVRFARGLVEQAVA